MKTRFQVCIRPLQSLCFCTDTSWLAGIRKTLEKFRKRSDKVRLSATQRKKTEEESSEDAAEAAAVEASEKHATVAAGVLSGSISHGNISFQGIDAHVYYFEVRRSVPSKCHTSHAPAQDRFAFALDTKSIRYPSERMKLSDALLALHKLADRTMNDPVLTAKILEEIEHTESSDEEPEAEETSESSDKDSEYEDLAGAPAATPVRFSPNDLFHQVLTTSESN